MGQQILFMISNANMGLRELYTAVLSNEFPGWRVSFMSAMPERAVEIIAGYDLIIYELGKADDPRRIETLCVLGDEVHEQTAATIFTHLEGFVPDTAIDTLALHHVHAISGQVTWQDLTTGLRAYGARQGKARAAPGDAPTPASETANGRGNLLSRMQGMFRRDKG